LAAATPVHQKLGALYAQWWGVDAAGLRASQSAPADTSWSEFESLEWPDDCHRPFRNNLPHGPVGEISEAGVSAACYIWPETMKATRRKPSPKTPTAGPERQTFTFNAPDALSVMLVGDFTHWQANPIPMHKQPDGLWHVAVELPPGRYHYRFLVDGEWRDDPECTLRVRNPYGSQNCVRQVG